MTDYVNTFGGAAQDAASSTILGAEWDTEYENIATAVATKQDKIASPTDENLIELDASGVPTDAGIISGYLDGLTDVVEPRIASLELTAAPSNWVRAGNLYLPDGSSSLASFSIPSAVDNNWSTVGDSGHGTTDYNWGALDDASTYQAKALLVMAVVRLTTTNTVSVTEAGYFAKGDIASPNSFISQRYNHSWGGGVSGEVNRRTCWFRVPLSYDATHGVSFNIDRAQSTFGTFSTYLVLKGFYV